MASYCSAISIGLQWVSLSVQPDTFGRSAQDATLGSNIQGGAAAAVELGRCKVSVFAFIPPKKLRLDHLTAQSFLSYVVSENCHVLVATQCVSGGQCRRDWGHWSPGIFRVLAENWARDGHSNIPTHTETTNFHFSAPLPKIGKLGARRKAHQTIRCFMVMVALPA